MRVAIYTRVSTNNQTSENQTIELQRIADARSWNIVQEFTDDGISGAKSRDSRPALDQMLKAATQKKFDLVAVWSVDRLGRSLQGLVETVNELHAVDCDLYIHQQAIDTSTPAGRMSFQIFGALAEFERELIRERVRVGLERARANGVKLGRPSNLNDSVRAAIIALRNQNHTIRHIAAQLKVGVGTVYRVLKAAEGEGMSKVAT